MPECEVNEVWCQLLLLLRLLLVPMAAAFIGAGTFCPLFIAHLKCIEIGGVFGVPNMRHIFRFRVAQLGKVDSLKEGRMLG